MASNTRQRGPNLSTILDSCNETDSKLNRLFLPKGMNMQRPLIPKIDI